MRQAVYGTLKYGIYYSLKGFVISNQIGGEESLTTNVSIAVVAGAVSSAVANPTDVLKVRMQSGKSYVDKVSKKAVNQSKAVGAQSIRENISNPDRKARIGLIGAFKDVYQKEGIGGLWRGVSPTAQRASLVAGVQLPAYDLSQQLFIRHNVFTEAYVNNLAASIVAGLCACLASNPFDVIRTRMMDQRKLINVTTANRANKMQNPTKSAKMSNTNSRPKIPFQTINLNDNSNLSSNSIGKEIKSEHPTIYRSSFQCGYSTIRNEGFIALYRGFIPAFMRMGPWNIIFFLTYEQLKLLS